MMAVLITREAEGDVVGARGRASGCWCWCWCRSELELGLGLELGRERHVHHNSGHVHDHGRVLSTCVVGGVAGLELGVQRWCRRWVGGALLLRRAACLGFGVWEGVLGSCFGLVLLGLTDFGRCVERRRVDVTRINGAHMV